jgi:hypothetical protein
MPVVRYATLSALVLWLAAMTAVRFGDVVRRAEPIGYACGAAMLIGLLAMKLVGPPPHAFFARAAIAALMLGLAIGASFAPQAATMLTAVNIGLGFVLLMWYVRE